MGANEVALLRHLQSKGAPAARREILVDVFGYAHQAKSRAVDMAVRRLRQKLEDDPSTPALLLSKSGVGLYLTHDRPTPTARPGSTHRWAELSSDARDILTHLRRVPGRHDVAVAWCEWAAKEARRYSLSALELQAERKRAFLLCDLSPASGVMAQSQIIARLADQGWPVGVCQLTMATLACALDNWESALDGLDELRNSHELLPGYGTFVNLMSLLCKVHLGTRPGSALTSIPEGLELTGHSERESRALVSLLHAEGAAAMEGDPEKKREIASTYAARPGRVDLSPLLGHLATAFLRRSGHVAPA